MTRSWPHPPRKSRTSKCSEDGHAGAWGKALLRAPAVRRRRRIDAPCEPPLPSIARRTPARDRLASPARPAPVPCPHAPRLPRRPRPRPNPVSRHAQFRDALAEFATGVTVIATREPDPATPLPYAGFTANSFNSVSLEPPLVVWSLATAAGTLTAFERCERYAINVLAHDQVAIARRFSRPHADRFAGVPFRLGWADAPLIDGCVAWFECRHLRAHSAPATTCCSSARSCTASAPRARARVPPRPLRADDAAALSRDAPVTSGGHGLPSASAPGTPRQSCGTPDRARRRRTACRRRS